MLVAGAMINLLHRYINFVTKYNYVSGVSGPLIINGKAQNDKSFFFQKIEVTED